MSFGINRALTQAAPNLLQRDKGPILSPVSAGVIPLSAIAGGVVIGAATGNYQMPTAADLNTILPANDMAVGETASFLVYSTGVMTITTNTGITLAGTAAISGGLGIIFITRTAAATFTVQICGAVAGA